MGKDRRFDYKNREKYFAHPNSEVCRRLLLGSAHSRGGRMSARRIPRPRAGKRAGGACSGLPRSPRQSAPWTVGAGGA
eukprot:317530-Pyramimonas_sp.AAC.1